MLVVGLVILYFCCLNVVEVNGLILQYQLLSVLKMINNIYNFIKHGNLTRQMRLFTYLHNSRVPMVF